MQQMRMVVLMSEGKEIDYATLTNEDFFCECGEEKIPEDDKCLDCRHPQTGSVTTKEAEALLFKAAKRGRN